MGTHILDVARFLFGETTRLYCQTHKVHADIKGEDAASVMLSMRSGATITCNLSYASKVEHDRFPEAFVFVEGTRGSLELAPDFWIRQTTSEGTVRDAARRLFTPGLIRVTRSCIPASSIATATCCAHYKQAVRPRPAQRTTSKL